MDFFQLSVSPIRIPISAPYQLTNPNRTKLLALPPYQLTMSPPSCQLTTSNLTPNQSQRHSHVDFLHGQSCQDCPQMTLQRLQNLKRNTVGQKTCQIDLIKNKRLLDANFYFSGPRKKQIVTYCAK